MYRIEQAMLSGQQRRIVAKHPNPQCKSCGTRSLIRLAWPLLTRLSTFALTANVESRAKFLVLMLFRDLLEAMQLVYTNALRAVGDTTFVLLARTITSVLVWTPAFLLAARASSPVWTWLTMPLAFAIHTAILSIRWHRGNWETIEIIRSSSNCR